MTCAPPISEATTFGPSLAWLSGRDADARELIPRGVGLALALAWTVSVVGCARGTGAQTGLVPPSPVAPADLPAQELEGWEVLSTRQIQHHWSDLLADASLDGPSGGGLVEVDCAVDARGRVVRAEVARTTVDRILTRYCLRAIRDRSPLPPPPGDASHAWRVTFVYEHAPRATHPRGSLTTGRDANAEPR
jgi:TonB family protein